MKEVENLSKGTERGPGEGQISQEPQQLEGAGVFWEVSSCCGPGTGKGDTARAGCKHQPHHHIRRQTQLQGESLYSGSVRGCNPSLTEKAGRQNRRRLGALRPQSGSRVLNAAVTSLFLFYSAWDPSRGAVQPTLRTGLPTPVDQSRISPRHPLRFVSMESLNPSKLTGFPSQP